LKAAPSAATSAAATSSPATRRTSSRRAAASTDAYRQLDASISYSINKNLQITAQAVNLLDETYYQYSSTPDAPTSIYKNGRVFSIAGTARF